MGLRPPEPCAAATLENGTAFGILSPSGSLRHRQSFIFVGEFSMTSLYNSVISATAVPRTGEDVVLQYVLIRQYILSLTTRAFVLPERPAAAVDRAL